MNSCRIGIVGPWMAASNPHTVVLCAAVEEARRELASYADGVELLFWDDQACAEGGRRAALELSVAGVDAVVGHYSSASAYSAAPIYQAADIPLFLPGATATGLTAFANVFRICDNDQDYAEFIVRWLQEQQYTHVVLAADDSVHGRSLSEALRATGAAISWQTQPAVESVIFFAGVHDTALCYLQHFLQQPAKLLLLADDALTQEIAAAASRQPSKVRVFGFRRTLSGVSPRWLQLARSGNYFFETLAALQIAVQWKKDTVDRCFTTVLGPARFGPDRELRPRRVAVVGIDSSGMMVELTGLADVASLPGAGA
jgi:hypothetical protein